MGGARLGGDRRDAQFLIAPGDHDPRRRADDPLALAQLIPAAPTVGRLGPVDGRPAHGKGLGRPRRRGDRLLDRRGLLALVGQGPVDELLDRVGQGRLPLGAEGSVDHASNPRDDRPDRCRRDRSPAGGVLEALREHQLERFRTALSVGGADSPERQRLDGCERSRARFLDDQVHERRHRRHQALTEVAVLAIGRADPHRRHREDLVERRQEAGRFAVEVPVEVALRNPRQRDQLGEGGARVAMLGYRLEHRPFEPRFLVLGDALGRHPVATPRQGREHRLLSFRSGFRGGHGPTKMANS